MRWAMVLLCVAGWVGCGQEIETAYRARAKAKELPAKHQTEIGEALTRYFGTPISPRMKLPKEGSAEDEAIELVDFLPRAELQAGQAVYARQCQSCHGATGDGEGPAAATLNPKPRNYLEAKFKFGATPRGYKPRRDDLVRIVRRGAKGTSMPAFRLLDDEDVHAVVSYVMALTSRGELEKRLLLDAEDLDEDESFDPKDIATAAKEIAESWGEAKGALVEPVSQRIPYSDESVKLGRQAFVKESCYKCHGVDGRGSGRRSLGKDDWGHDSYAANLAAGMLHGGRRPLDIYRRIHAGINGTPMPAYADALKDRPETMWHLVNFVTSVVEGVEIPKEELAELAAEAERMAAEAANPGGAKPEEKPDESQPDDKASE